LIVRKVGEEKECRKKVMERGKKDEENKFEQKA
jgi:hypothetical protein